MSVELTATQFVWRCLGLWREDYLPPTPPGPARDARCWLCGGATEGCGWPRYLALSDKFTNHTLARVPTSGAICVPCAGLAGKAIWDRYVATHGARLGIKTGHAMSWRSYSHLFAPGLHRCPTRAEWAAILCDPPEPPFLAVIAVSGQKHLLFRAAVAWNRDRYPVQFEEQRVYVDRARLARYLHDVTAMLALGARREEIVSGRYAVERLRTTTRHAWQQAETALAEWRRADPVLLQLATFIAPAPESRSGPQPEPQSEPQPEPEPWSGAAPRQLQLFSLEDER
jgi:hypothetical protein